MLCLHCFIHFHKKLTAAHRRLTFGAVLGSNYKCWHWSFLTTFFPKHLKLEEKIQAVDRWCSLHVVFFILGVMVHFHLPLCVSTDVCLSLSFLIDTPWSWQFLICLRFVVVKADSSMTALGIPEKTFQIIESDPFAACLPPLTCLSSLHLFSKEGGVHPGVYVFTLLHAGESTCSWSKTYDLVAHPSGMMLGMLSPSCEAPRTTL